MCPAVSTRPSGRSPCSQPARDGRFCVTCLGPSRRRRSRRGHRCCRTATRCAACPRRAAPGDRGQPPHHQARDVPRQAALAVPQGPHRRRHRRARRADRRRARADRAPTAVKEIEPYLVGKDPRRVVHHWQAIYRHAFYRGGPVLTSALSRHRHGAVGHQGQGARRAGLRAARRADARSQVRVYAHARTIDGRQAQGVAAGSPRSRPARASAARRHRGWRVRRDAGSGRSRPSSSSPRCARRSATTSTSASTSTARSARRTAKLLIKALEPYQPMFVEEPVNCQNRDVMAEIARGTHLPIATGERIFTKWGFREMLEKQAADDPAARPVPRRRHHRVPADRRHGRGVLRGDRAAQPARPDLAGGRACSSPRRSRTSCARSR